MLHECGGRLIPAGAGSTRWPCSTSWCGPAHPRRGGEHGWLDNQLGWGLGSSPPGRGAPTSRLTLRETAGLIPAGAGSTAQLVVRGIVSDGSSPPGRGALQLLPLAREARRLIPAGAGSTSRLRPVHRSIPAHPRRGGEHCSSADAESNDAGSSPPGRGARAGQDAGPGNGGLIPAGAGSTAQGPVHARAGRAHPRRGGEHTSTLPITCGLVGSSPPGRGALRAAVSAPRPLGLIPAGARGAPEEHLGEVGDAGLIPAGAGSTSSLARPAGWSRAHPRRGGEHCGREMWWTRREGSSPPGRGALGGRDARGRLSGLIPAGAGEHRSASRRPTRTHGSSPPGRGALLAQFGSRLVPRLIPAGAGSTAKKMEELGISAAHPRRGGEHVSPGRMGTGRWGSSPPGRGAPIQASHRHREIRLIPAGAGSTFRPAAWARGGGAHPRRGGEHDASNGSATIHTGSSPPGRGAPIQASHRHREIRLIPAGAGSTLAAPR